MVCLQMLEAYLELGFRGRFGGWGLYQWALVYRWLDYLRGPNILGSLFVCLLSGGIVVSRRELLVARSRQDLCHVPEETSRSV